MSVRKQQDQSVSSPGRVKVEDTVGDEAGQALGDNLMGTLNSKLFFCHMPHTTFTVHARTYFVLFLLWYLYSILSFCLRYIFYLYVFLQSKTCYFIEGILIPEHGIGIIVYISSQFSAIIFKMHQYCSVHIKNSALQC